MLQSLDGEWSIAADPKNEGRARNWAHAPARNAALTRVPGIIQNPLPDYHGVAWYWRLFASPTSADPNQRTLLTFESVDYIAEIYVNGALAGSHEGADAGFTIDITSVIHPGSDNVLAVRVLNPGEEPIDGMTRENVPHRCKGIGMNPGGTSNYGGILGSVALSTSPPVRLDDLWVWGDPNTGIVSVRGSIMDTIGEPGSASITLSVAAASSGAAVVEQKQHIVIGSSGSAFETELCVPSPVLWEPDKPYLYRVTARMEVETPLWRGSTENSTRIGFRDFRFENGYFRLNGRRIYLRCGHTLNMTPIGGFTRDSELLRRDMLIYKVMGFNAVRFIWGTPTREQADLCDELGLMIYCEHTGSHRFEDSPDFKERYDRCVAQMIRQFRNHPSVVIWGLLNEIFDGPQFRQAAASLPLVRSLDDTRLVMLNSGRFDRVLSIGSLCNPGSHEWECSLGNEGLSTPEDDAPCLCGCTPCAGCGYTPGAGDAHAYPQLPVSASNIEWLRTLGRGGQNVFLSEFGIGTGVNLWRLTRYYEQNGATGAEDARYYKSKLDPFLVDWEKWNMETVFSSPDDFFDKSIRRGGQQRTLCLNAVRANPHLNGYSVTGAMDHVSTGEGLITLLRELKPGTTDALAEGFAPLRLCLFAEPLHVYRGGRIHLEVVLANEDILMPGRYRVRLQVFAPDGTRPFQREIDVAIPDTPEPPFALPVYADDIVIDGPRGTYRFLAEFEGGAAPTGGEAVFFVDDKATLPRIMGTITLWGEDPILSSWLTGRGIAFQMFADAPTDRGEVILCGESRAGVTVEALDERIAQGATAIFLSPALFSDGGDLAKWPPLANGKIISIDSWLYNSDSWNRTHPVFAELPSAGLMDYVFYREILSKTHYTGLDAPELAIAATNKTSQDYHSGLLMASHTWGAGRFYLNTLKIRENQPPKHPGGGRLHTNQQKAAGAR